jgi:hypothetical protein
MFYEVIYINLLLSDFNFNSQMGPELNAPFQMVNLVDFESNNNNNFLNNINNNILNKQETNELNKLNKSNKSNTATEINIVSENTSSLNKDNLIKKSSSSSKGESSFSKIAKYFFDHYRKDMERVKNENRSNITLTELKELKEFIICVIRTYKNFDSDLNIIYNKINENIK